MHSVTSEKISCPICGEKPNGQMNNLKQYWYCTQCSLGWIKEIPKTTYKESYYTSGSSILAKLFVPLEVFFYKIRESYIGMQKKAFYIDVGAGDGNFLSHVNAKRKIGVEISQSGRKIMEKNGLETLSPKEFINSKNKKADVISFWHVLEHVDHPIDYIKAAKNTINKSGKIVIAVPNADSFEFRLFKQYWFHLTPQFHIWFFTPRALKRILKLADLKIERIDYWTIEHHFAGILQSFINFTTHTDNALHKLIKRRQDLSSLSFASIFWIIFWCTIGLPIVFFFWIIASLSKKSGAIVVIASKK
jgi:2-polyprenyl-3-methyl-5-hydroxy-6-metoxy-1,4-benzoquinol methylase